MLVLQPETKRDWKELVTSYKYLVTEYKLKEEMVMQEYKLIEKMVMPGYKLTEEMVMPRFFKAEVAGDSTSFELATLKSYR